VGQRDSPEAIETRKKLSPLPRMKPPLLDQLGIHFAATLTEIVSSHYIKALRPFKKSSFKDYEILKDNNTVLSFIWISSANTNNK
jgi:hypothetical protein